VRRGSEGGRHCDAHEQHGGHRRGTRGAPRGHLHPPALLQSCPRRRAGEGRKEASKEGSGADDEEDQEGKG